MTTRVVGLILLVTAPVLAAAYPATLRIPPLKARVAPTPALFSHPAHATFRCYTCHPTAFPQAAVGFSHEEMTQGRFCGGCHDGHLSFAIRGAACTRCHVPTR